MAGAADVYKLYGMDHSYYTGKVRPYLRFKGIPHREVLSTLLVYQRFIQPRTGVRFIPVLQTPEDEVVQDTTEIIEFLEARFTDRPVIPQTPRQKLVALLLELYADEWFLLPAMHFRWNYLDRHEAWLMEEFGRVGGDFLPAFVRRQIGRRVSGYFRGSIPNLGVTPRTAPAIEAWFRQFLSALDTHLGEHPFLLGTRPSLADFAMAGPLYAHVWRDPGSRPVIEAQGPRTVEWLHRMNESGQDAGTFLPGDAVPETLFPILAHLFAEQWPLLQDTSTRLAAWRGEHPEKTRISRVIGEHTFRIGDVEERRLVFPYAQWMMQRPLDHYASLDVDEKASVDALLKKVGGLEAMQWQVPARVRREKNRLVFAS